MGLSHRYGPRSILRKGSQRSVVRASPSIPRATTGARSKPSVAIVVRLGQVAIALVWRTFGRWHYVIGEIPEPVLAIRFVGVKEFQIQVDVLFAAGAEQVHVPDAAIVIASRRNLLAQRLVPEMRVTDLDLHRHADLDLLDRAWKLRGNISAYDAMYVALAEAIHLS